MNWVAAETATGSNKEKHVGWSRAHTAPVGGKKNWLGKKIVTADGPNAHIPRQATSVWPLSDKPNVFRPRYCFGGEIRALLTNGDYTDPDL